jgi:hypothetical protein
MKGPQFVTVTPMFRWTDPKIRVMALTGRIVPPLNRQRAREASIRGSTPCWTPSVGRHLPDDRVHNGRPDALRLSNALRVGAPAALP